MSVNGTLVEDKMLGVKGESEHFSFNMCPIYTHDGASAKFSTNSQEMDNSARFCYFFYILSFKNYVNVPSKSNKQKNFSKN